MCETEANFNNNQTRISGFKIPLGRDADEIETTFDAICLFVP